VLEKRQLHHELNRKSKRGRGILENCENLEAAALFFSPAMNYCKAGKRDD
jgi:hypothetical protein